MPDSARELLRSYAVLQESVAVAILSWGIEVAAVAATAGIIICVRAGVEAMRVLHKGRRDRGRFDDLCVLSACEMSRNINRSFLLDSSCSIVSLATASGREEKTLYRRKLILYGRYNTYVWNGWYYQSTLELRFRVCGGAVNVVIDLDKHWHTRYSWNR